MNEFWLILGLSLICGVLYRLGGWEKGNRLFRIVGCPLLTLIATITLVGFNLSYWWAYLLTFALSAGAVSAYWGLDEQKWGYWAHGLGLSLALLPIAYVTQHWLGFSLRCLVLTALITLWSEFTGWDILEEGGRGFLIIATLPLLIL